MTSYYVLNTLGCPLDESKLSQIPAPRLELFSHVTLKCVQGGGVLGGAVVAPITCAIKGEFNKESLQQRSYSYGLRGLQIGAVIGPIMYMSWAMSAKPTTDGVRDRCYRLRFNKNQVFSDRMGIIGLAAGVGAAKYLGEELGKGMVFGFTGGLITAGLINTVAGWLN